MFGKRGSGDSGYYYYFRRFFRKRMKRKLVFRGFSRLSRGFVGGLSFFEGR